MKVTIDPANDKPITVRDDDGVRTYDTLNILDKQGNTVGQIIIEGGEIVVKGEALFPGNTIAAHRQARRRLNRTNRPCGCLGG